MLKFKSMVGLLVFSMIAIGSEAQVKEEKELKKPEVTDTILDDTKDAVLDNIPVVSLDENDNLDGSAQNISSQLNNGRNPFINAASFNFNAVRFRIRGYDSDLFSTNMNGVPMENLDNGFTPYGLWGGLNDVLRNKTYTPGLQSNRYEYGGLGGSTFIDTRASKQRKQTSIGYAYSNRNYTHRVSLTKSTGFTNNGWAFSFAGSRRWADEGFTDGTFYDGWSAYIGIDKRFDTRHLLSLVVFGTPTRNGRQGASVQEMLDIAGTNYYNPYWGYQDGKKRNASVAKSFQPIAILTHEWKINSKTTLLSAVSGLTGNRSTTGLDWYNAADPRPDYYRYLPSYQEDPVFAEAVREELKNDVNKRQINWDALYNTNYANRETIQNVNGIQGNEVSGRRSLYIVEDRINHTNKLNFNTTLNAVVNKHIDITAGITYENQRNHYFKKVDDLLGGEFYVDINQFAERDFPTSTDALQNDLNTPNRILHQGDKFGYNYDINIHRASAWAQTNVKLHALDFFVSASHSYTRFQRTGNVRNGLFPDDSYGEGDAHEFYNYAVKGGLSYRVARGQYLFTNLAYETRAPYFENAYLSLRTRDDVQANLRSENISSAEAGYLLIAPTVKLRLTGYYTQFKNQTDVLIFYDDLARAFGNYALSHIGKEHMGIEMGSEVIVYKGLTLNAAAGIGRFRYNTRQVATVTEDNSANILAKDVVFADNFYVATPQEAYTVGLNYRSRKYWYVNVNFNYFDQMYLQISPVRRTIAATDGLDPNSAQWHSIVDQTRLKAQHTLDVFAGYSWLLNNRYKGLKKRTFMLFNLGVNNVLDNRTIVSGGFEQLRFDYAEKNVNKFPPKRFYAYGLNFFASVGIRF